MGTPLIFSSLQCCRRIMTLKKKSLIYPASTNHKKIISIFDIYVNTEDLSINTVPPSNNEAPGTAPNANEYDKNQSLLQNDRDKASRGATQKILLVTSIKKQATLVAMET